MSFLVAVFLCFILFMGPDLLASFQAVGAWKGLSRPSASRSTTGPSAAGWWTSVIFLYSAGDHHRPAAHAHRAPKPYLVAWPRTANRRRDLLELLAGIAIVGPRAFIGSFALVRVDLTSEKRYTLTDATKDPVAAWTMGVREGVLDGELPADLRGGSPAPPGTAGRMRCPRSRTGWSTAVDPNASPTRRPVARCTTSYRNRAPGTRASPCGKRALVTERIVFPGALMPQGPHHSPAVAQDPVPHARRGHREPFREQPGI